MFPWLADLVALKLKKELRFHVWTHFMGAKLQEGVNIQEGASHPAGMQGQVNLLEKGLTGPAY